VYREKFAESMLLVRPKKVILSGPEGLEGQKIREPSTNFQRPRMRTLSRALHLFYRGGQHTALQFRSIKITAYRGAQL
jgi:hypothetical protein